LHFAGCLLITVFPLIFFIEPLSKIKKGSGDPFENSN
jgi:hypothetical protein